MIRKGLSGRDEQRAPWLRCDDKFFKSKIIHMVLVTPSWRIIKKSAVLKPRATRTGGPPVGQGGRLLEISSRQVHSWWGDLEVLGQEDKHQTRHLLALATGWGGGWGGGGARVPLPSPVHGRRFQHGSSGQNVYLSVSLRKINNIKLGNAVHSANPLPFIAHQSIAKA